MNTSKLYSVQVCAYLSNECHDRVRGTQSRREKEISHTCKNNIQVHNVLFRRTSTSSTNWCSVYKVI